MRRALVLGVLLGCTHGAAVAPPPHHEVPKVSHIATPTTDPIPKDDEAVVLLYTDRYNLSVYADGMVEWEGFANVQSYGERHGRVDADTLAVLHDAFVDAKFFTMETPVAEAETCDHEVYQVEYEGDADGQINTLDEMRCPDDPALTNLISKIMVTVGVDQWIHGNPPSPAGQLPDGDHVLVRTGKSACYGSCPAYQVTLYDDGTLLWEGFYYVAKEGPLLTHVDADAVATITAAIDAASAPADSDAHCTDTSHDLIEVHRNGQWTTLDDPHCGDDSPLSELEDQLRWLLIGDNEWIRTPQPWITVERTNCKAQDCKAFTVTLLDNGRLVWNGTSDVATDGEARAWLPWAEVVKLATAFDDAKFFEITPHTDDGLNVCFTNKKGKKVCQASPCADDGFEHVKVTYTDGKQTKTLEDNGCDHTTALGTLEHVIYDVPQIAAWIGAWT
jgi:hypothetical protein